MSHFMAAAITYVIETKNGDGWAGIEWWYPASETKQGNLAQRVVIGSRQCDWANSSKQLEESRRVM